MRVCVCVCVHIVMQSGGHANVSSRLEKMRRENTGENPAERHDTYTHSDIDVCVQREKEMMREKATKQKKWATTIYSQFFLQ